MKFKTSVWKFLHIRLAFYLTNGVFLLLVLSRLSLIFYQCIQFFPAGFPFNHTPVSLHSDNGFEEGLSTLALVSGLFSAMWSVGWVAIGFSSHLQDVLSLFYRWRLETSTDQDTWIAWRHIIHLEQNQGLSLHLLTLRSSVTPAVVTSNQTGPMYFVL